jgi:hypothetical protein
MTDTITGTVKKITSKEVGKYSNLAYILCVFCDDNEEEEWFGHGFDKPVCFEGDKVSFDVTYKGEYANIDVNSMAITAEGPREPAPEPKRAARGAAPARGRAAAPSRRGSAPAAEEKAARSGRGAPAAKNATRGASKPVASSGGGLSKDQFWENKEKRDINRDLIIQLQSAQNTAIATIVGAVAAGVVALPTGKKGEKFDAFIALIDEEAMRLREVYLAGGHTSGPVGKAASQEEEQYDDDDDIPE